MLNADKRITLYGGVAALNLLGLFCGIVALPGDDSEAAAIFPPWWSSAEAVQAAATAGQPERVGLTSAIVLVHSERDGLPGRLYRAGAFLVLPSKGFGLCRAPNNAGAARV